jgi:hypothetical protein
MDFWASAEVYQPAFSALDRVRKHVEATLNEAFCQSSLASLEFKLRYIPIVMPKELHSMYPARSKLRKKEHIYDCAPILNYEIFTEESFKAQVQEYIRGIALSAKHLEALGCTPQQVVEFEEILSIAHEKINLEGHFATAPPARPPRAAGTG